MLNSRWEKESSPAPAAVQPCPTRLIILPYVCPSLGFAPLVLRFIDRVIGETWNLVGPPSTSSTDFDSFPIALTRDLFFDIFASHRLDCFVYDVLCRIVGSGEVVVTADAKSRFL